MNRKDALVGMGLLLAGCSGGALTSGSQGGLCSAGGLRGLLCAGGVITLSAGTWVIDDPPLLMPAGTTIRGAGIGITVIKYTGASYLLIDADNAVISDLTLDGSLCPPPKPGQNTTAPDVALVMLRSTNSTLLRVRIQSSSSFGVFSHGAQSPTVQDCQFDDCGRNDAADTLGGGPDDDRFHLFNHNVLYTGNVFTNCHGNAIDNCCTTGTWINNSVISIVPPSSVSSPNRGDVIADGGSTVVIQNNTLYVASIQVYGATSGCLAGNGEPQGCQIVDNVIQTGTLCDVPLCHGLYVVAGNTHHGNVIAGVVVD